MEHVVMHTLPLPQAKQVARLALDNYAARFAKYAPTLTWRSDSEAEVRFGVNGMSFAGTFAVEPDRFRLNLEVPFLLRAFGGRAIHAIDREAREWIAKAESGAL